MTELDKLSRRQLARMVEVLRGALHDVEAVDYPYYPETRRICGESLSLSDRIAAEPVELTDWEVVMEWLFAGSDRFLQIANDRKSFHLFAYDAEGGFDSVQAFNGEPSPQLCVAQMAAWIRTQEKEGAS